MKGETVQPKLACLQEELAAIKKTASERLDETVSLKQEMSRLQTQLQEATHRPISDEQLHVHPQFAFMMKELQSVTRQANVRAMGREAPCGEERGM